MQVEKLGEGLIVRIPEDVAKALQLKVGDDVRLEPTHDPYAAIVEKVAHMTREEAIEGLREFRGRMPADYKFDRDEANAR